MGPDVEIYTLEVIPSRHFLATETQSTQRMFINLIFHFLLVFWILDFKMVSPTGFEPVLQA
jgi:hypothetical protein